MDYIIDKIREWIILEDNTMKKYIYDETNDL